MDYALLASAVGGLVALALIAMIHRRRRSQIGIPVVDWEARAQAAEQRAAEAEATVKAGLLPHLARLLRSKLVVGLLSQRRRLVDSHRKGAERAEALEERIASAHEGIQQKLKDYEAQLQQQQHSTPNHPSGPVTSTAQPTAATPPRRNPLAHKRPSPEPQPVKFADLLSKKRQAPSESETAEDRSRAQG